jgi:endonuclease/exonuclease/phosphatase family metal-dependent hydrolase
MKRTAASSRRGWCLGALALALAAGLAGCASREPGPAPAVLRVMTYNIRHGEGIDRRIDLARIAAVIRDVQPHLVALQEVDRGVARTARRDLPAELAQLTRMTGVFSNNYRYQGGEYGNAILTSLPVQRARNLHYPMLREAEQRGLLQVTVREARHRVVFMSTHLDYRRDDAERLQHVAEIAQATRDYGVMPVIVCGDFNALPGSATHLAMKEHFHDAWEAVGLGEGSTFPGTNPVRRIDYVFFAPNGRVTPLRAWVPSSPASDHLPLVVEFGLR